MGCFEIVQCTCNHQENPLGLDRTPRFGWKMRSDTRGDAQTAYRITVSTDARRAQAGQGDVWPMPARRCSPAPGIIGV